MDLTLLYGVLSVDEAPKLAQDFEMDLIGLSLKRPVFAWVLMASLIIFGAIALNRLGISQLPDVDFPVLTVSATYEGAAPEIIEAEILEPLETRLLIVEGIREMKSSARQGSGSITLEFDIQRNLDVALQEVQTATSQFRLPPGVDPLVVRKQNPEEDPILIVAIYAKSPIKDILTWGQNFLVDQLQFLPGVGDVNVGGFSERNLRVWVDTQRLKSYDLTILDVAEALRSQHLESAAGQFSSGARELRVRWLGEAVEPKEVESIQILRRGGQIINEAQIFVRDVARVEDGLSDIRRLARVDGKPAIALFVRKQRGTNEVEVAKSIRAKLDELRPSFPPDFEYRINVDFTRTTEATVQLTIEKLWMAALITILVCYLFLGNIPAAINILFSIPVSMFGTFLVLYFSGFTLNLFTLLALTLAISIVVDDAIMLLENIVRHYRMGKSPHQAALDGSKEVLPAAIAATLAVVAVFLPVIFMSGIIGRFFFQFGVTMSAAVLLSLLEAMTITPMRAAAFLSQKPKVSAFEMWLDRMFEKLSHRYSKGLALTLRYSKTTLLVSVLLFALSLLVFPKVRKEFVPAQDQDFIILSAQTKPGSSLAATDEQARKIEDLVRGVKEVKGFFVSVGAGGPNSQVNQIFMPLALHPKSERDSTHTQIMDRLRNLFKESLKGTRVSMRDISARNLTSGRLNPLAVRLQGPDLKVLDEKRAELVQRIEQEKLGVDLDWDYRVGIPELIVSPDRRAMALRGVSVEDVGRVLSAGVGGLRQGRYSADGRRYDIRFKFNEDQIQSPQDIQKLSVRNNVGNLVSLRDVVRISEQPASQGVNRVNRQRAISIYGNLGPGQSQATVIQKVQGIARDILPQGYTLSLEGASAGLSEAFSGLTTALWIGILVAFMILAVQFNSFIQPWSVLVALPFSLSGAFLALWIFDVSLNLFSFIGLIVLMGIAKKNSILLVEFTNQVTENEKLPVQEALLKACPVRLRPILMTSVATLAAALPLVIGSGFGSETRIPMGLTILGGTLISTIFTLYVVPALFLVLSRYSTRESRGPSRSSSLSSP